MDRGYFLYRFGLQVVIFSFGIIFCIVKFVQKRRIIREIFSKNCTLGEDYTAGNGLLFLRIGSIIFFIFFFGLCYCWLGFAKDIPYILMQDYLYVEGYTIRQAKGGADVSSEERSVTIIDESTGEEVNLVFFGGYVEKNTYIEAEYLPNTHYGVVLTMKE